MRTKIFGQLRGRIVCLVDTRKVYLSETMRAGEHLCGDVFAYHSLLPTLTRWILADAENKCRVSQRLQKQIDVGPRCDIYDDTTS